MTASDDTQLVPSAELIRLEDRARSCERIADAVERAVQSMTLLDTVPIAPTQSARQQMTATRLEVLERMLADVRAALPAPAPESLAALAEEARADA